VNVDNIPLGKGITGAAAESREPVRVQDTGADRRYIGVHPGIRSELAVPLIVQDRVVGVLDVESERVAYFTEDHQRTLSVLAPQIASSVENARLYEELEQREQRMEQDLKAARKLQRVLLPREARTLPGLKAAIRSRPAREISGDVYHFFEQGEDTALLAFGDVSGKGAAAALYGALISGLLHILGPEGRSPSELMKSLNETLLERKVDAQYAALVIARWLARERKLIFCNAGAGTPLICRSGNILRPHAEGVPIGLLEDREYEEVEFRAEPGDTILFCSDGVEDQLNSAEQDYSRARVASFLQAHCGEEPQAIVDGVIQDLDTFREGVPITDDQTVVALQVL
jgi:sigma-B regulation protein RsbU (phosphoserine phosphatase)